METWILFLVKAFSSGTPILYGTLGEIVNEKSGHLNLGVQGMMAVGGCAGFLTGYYSNNLFLALFAAFLGGVLTSLIYAFLTVTLMANQNVTGLTLTIFGVGLANFIGKFALNRTPTGTLKLPDGIAGQLKDIRFPFLEKIPGVGPWLYTLFSFNIFVYLAVAIAIVLAVYINHTKTGRNLRAIGENPAAAGRGRHPCHPDEIHSSSPRRRDLRPGRRLCFHDHRQRRLDQRFHRGSGMDRAGARHLCGLESRQSGAGLLPLRGAAGAAVLPLFAHPGFRRSLSRDPRANRKIGQAGCRVSRVPSTTCSPS